jgi:thiosulfate/3-mercaptopyruvate sulfurtransferase
MTHLISVNRLKNRLENKQHNTTIIDVRFQLNDPDAGRKAYLKSHLPGAVYLDLNKDLSSKKAKHGGNHPLPDGEMFAKKIGHLGIDHDSTVVIYDESNDMFAARLWWLLNYMGLEKVYILDGGYDQWIKAGNEVTDEVPRLEVKAFTPVYREDQIADMEEVKEKVANQTAILIDSRAKDRYLGKTEPMYAKAGHIPGAKNYFWQDVLNKDGLWKKEDALASHFASLPKDQEIIVSCGSGVSACPNVLALKTAGYENVKLYPGSYSDWISYEENKVEKREE